MYKDQKIYFAGPECFYPGGGKIELAAQKATAEYYGISTSRPGDKPGIDLAAIKDPRAKADAIFQGCVDKMNETDILIANLEFYRGTEPDGGTIFELGMAYAKGCKCYAYTRDKRNMLFKHQHAHLNTEDGKVYDDEGRLLPEKDFPFNLMITGSCKIVEGDFVDAVKVLRLDLEEESKRKGAVDYVPEEPKEIKIPEGKPKAYLAGPWVFEKDGKEVGKRRRELAEKYGIEVVFPEAGDAPRKEFDDIWSRQFHGLDVHMKQLQNSNVIIADLNDFHGYEPDSGTAFECGVAYWYGHKMYGFMDDAGPAKNRIPNVVREDGKPYDMYGNTVENFEYPLNLMFASPMKIFEGKFEEIIKQVAIDLGTYKE